MRYIWAQEGGDANGSGEGFTIRNFIAYTVHIKSQGDSVKKIRMRRSDDVATMKEVRRAFQIVSCKHSGKIPLGRPRHRWEENIRTDLKEIVINWVDSTRDWDF